jgi:alkanesulfonate monooxygenase SsuD/methylene tetrahydromethanopterin reductase-like flavin-dependent oxidoreductase (luciferase family)
MRRTRLHARPYPIVFLTAAAMRSKKTRLITGARAARINQPLKLAGEIGMVDAISCGRLEVGFARAFLPHEFARFGVSVHESRGRFEEGMEQVRRLLEEENVTTVSDGPRVWHAPQRLELLHLRAMTRAQSGKPGPQGIPAPYGQSEGYSISRSKRGCAGLHLSTPSPRAFCWSA